jgi:ribosome maturation factor RimP
MSSGRFFQPIFFGSTLSGPLRSDRDGAVRAPGRVTFGAARILGQQTGRSEPSSASEGAFSGAVQAAPGASLGAGSQDCIERTVTGLGFDLVDVERSARGLLRIFIDRVPGHAYPESQGVGEFVTVDDCEAVTRQLVYALEVENVPYERLEVSSPGIDRLLKKEADFVRFAGQAVNVTLKAPFQGRKHWRGVLGRSEAGWSLALQDERAGTELAFKLDEVREARLVPVFDFKGRGRAARPAG